ncbi:hypothetical protein D3C75_805010 [compost metagenome]
MQIQRTPVEQNGHNRLTQLLHLTDQLKLRCREPDITAAAALSAHFRRFAKRQHNDLCSRSSLHCLCQSCFCNGIHAAAFGYDHILGITADFLHGLPKLHRRFFGTLPGPPAENIAAGGERTNECNLLISLKRQHSIILEQYTRFLSQLLRHFTVFLTVHYLLFQPGICPAHRVLEQTQLFFQCQNPQYSFIDQRFLHQSLSH